MSAWGHPEDDVRVAFTTIQVANALGEVREGRMDSIGQLDCPFCRCVSHGEQCENSACEANAYANAETVLRRRAEREERQREEAERKARHEQVMAAQRRWNDERATEVAAVRDAGHCVVCFMRSGNRKRIRHRVANYHAA